MKQTVQRLQYYSSNNGSTTTNYNEIYSVENKDDGLFWMSYEDFVTYFMAVSVCMVRHPKYNLNPWQVARKPVYFALDTINHRVIHRCFRLIVTAPSVDFIFTLHQQDKRCQYARDYIDIGVVVLKSSLSGRGKYEYVTGTTVQLERQNQTEVVNLESGEYFIVPITTGCQLLHQTQNQSSIIPSPSSVSSSKLVDVPITDRPSNSILNKNDLSFSKYVVNAYKEQFESINLNADGFLDKYELDMFMKQTTDRAMRDDDFQVLLEAFEHPLNHSKGLSFDGYLKFQFFQFRKTGCDEERIIQEFLEMGFDNKLRSKNGRSVAMTVHGTAGHADPAQPKPIDFADSSSGKSTAKLYAVDGLPYDQDLVNEAQIMMICANGDTTSYDSGKYLIHVCDAGYTGVSVVVENCHSQSLKLKMDFSSSANVISHRGTLVHEESIPPYQKRIFQHLTPKDCKLGWSWTYSLTSVWNR